MDTICQTRALSKKYYFRKKGILKFSRDHVYAVDHVSLSITRGEAHGIVGESGSGKTTLARLILKLTHASGGRIIYNNQDITHLKGRPLKDLRRKMQIIFQDPYSSLDPRKTIASIVSEPLVVQKVPRRDFDEKIAHVLNFVNLPVSDNFLNTYPDELSGGQRQRVGIARTLIIDPEFIIADESVSMLDASIKAGIINLLTDLREKKNLTYLFITHELALAYHICDRISVMHQGRIVESGQCSDIIKNPLHPYTKELIEAIPPLLPDASWITRKEHGPFDRELDTKGCSFFHRCKRKTGSCQESVPVMKDFGNGHQAACNVV